MSLRFHHDRVPLGSAPPFFFFVVSVATYPSPPVPIVSPSPGPYPGLTVIGAQPSSDVLVAFRVSSPYLCQDMTRVVPLLTVWREDIATPPCDDDAEDTSRKEVFLRIQNWITVAPASTPWHEKGLALAMALEHISPETHRLLTVARDRHALWAGLAPTVLETPLGGPLAALEATVRSFLAPKEPLPSWFTTSLPPAEPGRGGAATIR